ncbi:hypothetical protein [Sinorhizobium meliloti]|nr:hypothetical protein [Sinorhizobium meliloti]
MSDDENTTPSELWIEWLRDYVTATTRFTREEPVEVASDEERELVTNL